MNLSHKSHTSGRSNELLKKKKVRFRRMVAILNYKCFKWMFESLGNYVYQFRIYFFFFLVVLLSFTMASPLRFWLLFCCVDVVNTPVLAVPLAGVELPLPLFFFFSRRSFSSSSWFSRSINVMSVLQRRCSSSAVRDFKNQSKRNCGDELFERKKKQQQRARWVSNVPLIMVRNYFDKN